MSDEKLIKKQIIKNMLLNFIAFTIIFSILGVILYAKVENSLYESSDKELLNSKNVFGVIQRMNGYGQSNIKFGNENFDFELENNSIDSQILKSNPLENESKSTENTVKSTNEDSTKTSESKDSSSKLIDLPKGNNKQSINPRIVYIIRNADGNITQQNVVTEEFNNVYFDSDDLETVYTTTIANQYKYRGITYTVNQDDEKYYVQILINVDAEDVIMQNFKITLLIALGASVLISLLASYLLSKKTLKPIIASWKKQTEFVQNASHELRTPLTIIQTKQELLLEEPDAKIIDKAEDITITLNETRRLSKMIKELMDLARTDSNKTQLKKEKIDIDSVIKEIAEPFYEMAKAQGKNMDLSLNYNKTLDVDVNKFHQLLVIVLDNSIKYTSGGDSIIIETIEKEGKLILNVKDTGIGISEEGINHVFERFYRDDKAHSRETGGSGLGLSIAKNIVDQHGGTIRALQNKPKGTIIEIKLK